MTQLHRLVTKPEQSGKTFIMLREMISTIEGELEGDQKNINLVYCDNNLMLVSLTLERVGDFPSLKNMWNYPHPRGLVTTDTPRWLGQSSTTISGISFAVPTIRG